MKDTILIVEDDRDIMEVVTIMLGREGFKVLKATNGKEAIEDIAKRPDLIILDVMLPDMDGFTVCRRIRQESLAPVLFLTAKTGVQDKTEGLEAGGDDYLVKPFFQEELRARIRALLRRYENYRGKDQNEPRDHYMEVGRFRVSEDFNEVLKDGKQISMTDIEYRKPYFYDANNTVMVHIRRLRMAIEDDPKKPVYIRTEWGRGYRFVSE